MPDETLSYEALLSALQGLLGESVFALIEVRYDSGLRLTSSDMSDVPRARGLPAAWRGRA